MNYEFVKDLIGSPWQIEPQTLNRFYPVFRGLFSGLLIEKSAEPLSHLPYALSASTRKVVQGYYADDQQSDPLPEQPKAKVVSVLPVRSILTKHDQSCGPVGTRSLSNRLLSADADENVIGHILLIESGGGQATAVPELAEAIQKCTKPVVAWIDGMAASAAYYIASYTREIICGREMDMVGCIGTMAMYEGRKSKSPENSLGEISVTIYADGSEEKNSEVESAINEFDFTLAKERLLNPFNEKFKADVLANRPTILAEQLKGRTYFASEVIGTLVDSIGSFDSAVERVLSLANFKSDPVIDNTSQATNTKIEMKQFLHLNQTLSLEALEATAEGTFLNKDQLQALEERLQANEQLAVQCESAVQQRDDANSRLTLAESTIATAYDSFNAIDPVIATAQTPEAKALAIRGLLSQRPSAPPIQAIGLPDQSMEDTIDWPMINNLPHNILADFNA